MNIKPRGEARKATVKKVLIVCEGEKTEPNYFRAFRVASQVCEIRGTGYNTDSLVKEAIRLSALANYREVWCVFDRDSFAEKNVRTAFQLATNHGLKIAFSNECFELWYLLHFKLLDTNLKREQYYKQLRELMGEYQKNSVDMHENLLNRQADAIRHATRLEAIYEEKTEPCRRTPYTTVC